MKNSLKQIISLFIFLSVFAACSVKINKAFDYNRFIHAADIQNDINQLKNNLESRHFDINWEGKKEKIFTSLDEIANIDIPITIDSFERRLGNILNYIDDGHSRVIHQKHLVQSHQNPFGVNCISDSVIYLRIGNFVNYDLLLPTLDEFLILQRQHPQSAIIIDIRNNRGGEIQIVNAVLSYFLPGHTKIFEKVEVRPTSFFTRITDIFGGNKLRQTFSKYTSNKKISGFPKIVVWINQNIASGSMLFSYHMQKNGARIAGKQPKGVYNTFGNAKLYKLPKSKLIYTLSSLRVFLDTQIPTRMEDMLVPDHEVDTKLNLNELLALLNLTTNQQK